MGLRDEGLRVFGAGTNPLAQRIRLEGDSPTVRADDDYAWEHTESFIKGLKERGFNLFITHFSKGYGISAEAEERENTRLTVRLCHKHGLYVGGYMRYTTFVPQTFKLDYPDCVERMACIGSKGMARYCGQYWRYIPCPSSTEYLQYLDRLIGIGIEDIGLDLLHVDGLDQMPEPYACHCPRCLAGFRAWLVQRYPTAKAQKQRFGFAPLDYVEIPDLTVNDPYPPTLPTPIAVDPVIQEWMFFRCRQLAKVWKFIVQAARRRNPACYVQGNPFFYPHLNPFWFYAGDMALLAEAGSDGFFTEEISDPALHPDGRLHGYFETFKKLRRLGFQVFAYNREPVTYQDITAPEALKRAMAHQMAFNLDAIGVSIYKTDGDKWPTVVPEYMAFHRDRRDLFRGTVQAHDVAVYYSGRNYALNCGAPLATQNLARDVMMRGHVPFGYLLESHRSEMKEFRAMVLPEVECMSEAEADDLAVYVRAGGGLLVLGPNTGRYNEFRRLHRKNALTSRLGVEWSDKSSAFTVRAGKGRVAFLPQLLSPDGSPLELARDDRAEKVHFFYGLKADQWRPPINAGEMLQLLEWAAGGYRFDVLVPNTVVVEFVRQRNPKRHLLHLVNFDLERDVGPFEIRCHFPVKRARAFTPDGKAPKVGLIPGKGGPSVLQVEGFRRYLIVAVS